MEHVTKGASPTELRNMLEDLRYDFERMYHPGFDDDECAAIAAVFARHFAAIVGQHQLDLDALVCHWRDILAETET
jgi:hypothetical protein